MATEQKATVTYTSDGTQKVYAFPFDYLQKSFVNVKADAEDLVYGTDYVVVDKQVELTSARTKGVVLVIYRKTPTDRLVSWTDASVLSASDMTLFEVQLLHIAEETSDKVQESGLALDEIDDVWDARYTRLKNLLDPESAGDAVTKRYFESVQAGYIQANQALVNEATTQKNLATTQAQNAASSASAAKTSETNAASSATASANSATSSANSATSSANSATAASASANNAATNATNAATSATNAAASVTVATNEANRAKTEADRSYSEAERARTLTEGVIIPVPSMPVGTPFPWFSSTFPDGTLECNGQTFNTTAYPKLAQVYPTGKLPDLRGVVLRGLDRGRGLDPDTASRTVGSYQDDAFQGHAHKMVLWTGKGGDSSPVNVVGYHTTRYSVGGYDETAMIASDGVNGNPRVSTETRMKNVACYWLVYATNVAYDTCITDLKTHTALTYDAAHLFGASGYQKFSNGLIFQWCAFTNSDTDTTVTFPIAFTTACLGVMVTINSSLDSAAQRNERWYNATTTNVIIDNGSGEVVPTTVFAWGY